MEKILIVEDEMDNLKTLAARLKEGEKPPKFKTLQEIANEQAFKEGVKPQTVLNRIRRRYGFNPQKAPHAPKAAVRAGQEVRLGELGGSELVHAFWVAKVKSDGRLRLKWSGWHPDPGTPVSIGQSWYLVTARSSAMIYLNPITFEQAKNVPANRLFPDDADAQRAVVKPEFGKSPLEALLPKIIANRQDRAARKAAKKQGLETRRWVNSQRNERERQDAVKHRAWEREQELKRQQQAQIQSAAQKCRPGTIGGALR